MAKYRKKSVVVEAYQWHEPPEYKDALEDHKGGPLPKGVHASWFHRSWGTRLGGWIFYVITIRGQRAWLADGDWVLPEPDGVHFYPCKPDIFAATYEVVTDA